ncbi:MAG: hypothetical protein AAFU85_16395 [Planctomycetota bacterium]
MSDNLCAQYDQAVTWITEYQAYRQSVWRRQFGFRGMLYLLKKDKFGGLFREAKREQAELPLHSSPIIAELAESFATPEQKGSPFYRIYVSEYPLHELCGELLLRFRDAPLDKLAEFHEKRRTWQGHFTLQLRGFLTLAIGFGTFVLNTTPKAVVEQLGGDHGDFQVAVFWGTAIFVGYLGVYFSLFWRWADEARRKADFVQRVLEYAALQNGDKKTRPRAARIATE